ncbi:MAG TPA: hypothetical protein VI094_02270 [Propionibacteriaceae bacterium]
MPAMRSSGGPPRHGLPSCHRHVLAAAGDQPGAGTRHANPVIFGGDLNDEPLAATTQIIQGPGGSEIDFRTGSGFRTGDRGDGYRTWNLYRQLPSDGPNFSCNLPGARANSSTTYSPRAGS